MQADSFNNTLTFENLLNAVEFAIELLEDSGEYNPSELMAHIATIREYCHLSDDEQELLNTISEMLPNIIYPIDTNEIDYDFYLSDDEGELSDNDYESIAESEMTSAYESIHEGLKAIVKKLTPPKPDFSLVWAGLLEFIEYHLTGDSFFAPSYDVWYFYPKGTDTQCLRIDYYGNFMGIVINGGLRVVELYRNYYHFLYKQP